MFKKILTVLRKLRDGTFHDLRLCFGLHDTGWGKRPYFFSAEINIDELLAIEKVGELVEKRFLAVKDTKLFGELSVHKGRSSKIDYLMSMAEAMVAQEYNDSKARRALVPILVSIYQLKGSTDGGVVILDGLHRTVVTRFYSGSDARIKVRVGV